MKIQFHYILTLTFIGLISSGILIPDPQNPISITYPHKLGELSTIMINFQLSPGRSLSYNQYIAVALPKYDGENLLANIWQFNLLGNQLCTLTRDASTSYLVENIASPLGEEHIAYCKINDVGLTEGKMPLTSGYTYRLEIKLNNSNQKLSQRYLRNIDLWTTTGLGSSGIILDTAIGLGQGAIYDDYKASSSHLVSIQDIKVINSVGDDSSNMVFQYNTFDIRIKTKEFKIKTSDF